MIQNKFGISFKAMENSRNYISSLTPSSRGAFIVFEGCDCSGKSTQSKLLVSFLQNKNLNVKHMCFPDRSLKLTGQLIDSYLKNKIKLPDECIHLMFSTNRWELNSEMKEHLESGTILVVDRYSYSGIAYSRAKGLQFDWCKAPERGLLQPDIVFYLKTDIEKLAQRNDFGMERYEKVEFQSKVADIFDRIYEAENTYWHKVDANHSIEAIEKEISKKTMEIIENVKNQPLKLI